MTRKALGARLKTEAKNANSPTIAINAPAFRAKFDVLFD